MAEPQITPELQAQVQQLQSMAGQLQQIGAQRQQMESMKLESDNALEALKEAPEDAPVWRQVGSVMVQEKSREAAIERLTDDSETLEIRIKRTKGQEEAMREQLNELQAKLQAAFKQ